MTRRLKVYEHYRKSIGKQYPVPKILISGVYLQNLGFNIGDTVEIYSEKNGLLNIKKVID